MAQKIRRTQQGRLGMRVCSDMWNLFCVSDWCVWVVSSCVEFVSHIELQELPAQHIMYIYVGGYPPSACYPFPKTSLFIIRIFNKIIEMAQWWTQPPRWQSECILQVHSELYRPTKQSEWKFNPTRQPTLFGTNRSQPIMNYRQI